jgi:uncharacterized protein
VGSKAHGIATDSSDNDIKGVRIESLDEAMGLSGGFEQFEFRTAAERTGKHDAPSEEGDFDVTIYGLRKFLRLALKGNPSVVELLFTVPDYSDSRGMALRELRDKIVSQRAAGAYIGYAIAQRNRLVGKQGQMRVNRQALIEKHGYDTKYAAHALRLAYQGCELLDNGFIQLPMRERDAKWIREVRDGRYTLDEVVQQIDSEIERLGCCYHAESLPNIRPEPDHKAVNEWMLKMYLRQWSAERQLVDWLEDSEFFNVKAQESE